MSECPQFAPLSCEALEALVFSSTGINSVWVVPRPFLLPSLNIRHRIFN